MTELIDRFKKLDQDLKIQELKDLVREIVRLEKVTSNKTFNYIAGRRSNASTSSKEGNHIKNLTMLAENKKLLIEYSKLI